MKTALLILFILSIYTIGNLNAQAKASAKSGAKAQIRGKVTLPKVKATIKAPTPKLKATAKAPAAARVKAVVKLPTVKASVKAPKVKIAAKIAVPKVDVKIGGASTTDKEEVPAKKESKYTGTCSAALVYGAKLTLPHDILSEEYDQMPVCKNLKSTCCTTQSFIDMQNKWRAHTKALSIKTWTKIEVFKFIHN